MKNICVPKTAEAMKLLDYGQCPSDLLDELRISAADFMKIFELDLFLELSKSHGVWIDDYEEGCIIGAEALRQGRAICQKYVEENPDLMLLAKIRDLFDLALHQNTGVYFNF